MCVGSPDKGLRAELARLQQMGNGLLPVPMGLLCAPTRVSLPHWPGTVLRHHRPVMPELGEPALDVGKPVGR